MMVLVVSEADQRTGLMTHMGSYPCGCDQAASAGRAHVGLQIQRWLKDFEIAIES
jgi:hypothetical protein